MSLAPPPLKKKSTPLPTICTSTFFHSPRADVTVVAPDGTEHQLHMLLLAYHSEFFRRAFSSGFREKERRRIELHCSDPCNVFPTLVEYFYTDEVILTGRLRAQVCGLENNLSAGDVHAKVRPGVSS